MPGNFPQRGDIYHVEFDPPVGPHPAVIVTADVINQNTDTVVLAVVTSKGVDRIYPHEFRIPTGLLRDPSKVKCHTLITWPKEILNENTYIGTIDQRDMQGLDIALEKALNLWLKTG